MYFAEFLEKLQYIPKSRFLGSRQDAVWLQGKNMRKNRPEHSILFRFISF